jgi:hypothetical protein
MVRQWLLAIGVPALLLNNADAQGIVVDAAPSHVVNSFSPPRALGGAIDRLRGGGTRADNEKNTERLLTGGGAGELREPYLLFSCAHSVRTKP